MSITGIGPAKAADLNKENITLEKLLNEYETHKENLAMIREGLKHFDKD